MIELSNITFSYRDDGNGERPIFKEFDFRLRAGERVAVVGANGSGKTTLLRLIMGLERPHAGEIRIFGKQRKLASDFAEVRRRIGYVFQDADDQLFCPTVEEDIAFGPLNLGLSPKQARSRAREVLARIGLPDYGQRVTFNLSGGEKKLISLGTALAMRPELLILDEPTAGLDQFAEQRLESILNECGLPFLIVSHDPDFIDRTTERTVKLEAIL